MKLMKNLSSTVLALVLIVSGCSTTKDTVKEERSVKAAELRQAIDDRKFVVEVDRALPMGGSTRILTSPYALELIGDSVKSYLPYFGRAYSVPYGGGEGYIFNSIVTDYQSSIDKKEKAVIEFKTKSKEDQLTYRIHVSPNGTASITVISNNRQPISYNGKASKKEKPRY
jgi:hypothetical protein